MAVSPASIARRLSDEEIRRRIAKAEEMQDLLVKVAEPDPSTALGREEWRATPATMANHFLGDDTYTLWPYITFLADEIADAFNGGDPKKIINVASQYGKSSLLKWTAIWALDRNPKLRIMYVSYDADRAVDLGGDARDLAKDHASELRFDVRPDQRARGMWRTSAGGYMYSVGIHGGITGFPVDALLLDDLIKGWRVAHSDTERETVMRVYRSQCRKRLQSFNSPAILVGTRWHRKDPTGQLLDASAAAEDADQWKHIRLPTISEANDPQAEDPLNRAPDPLGREPGELLEPARFDEQEVTARRRSDGEYLWAAMEQQRPSPEAGNEILREWWRMEDQAPPGWDTLISSWDLKMKDISGRGSYVVGQVWGRTGSDAWIIDQIRGQWNQAMTQNAIALLYVRHPKIQRHVIENKASAPEVMKALKTAMPGYEVSDEIAGALGMTVAERTAVQTLRRRGMGQLVGRNIAGEKETRMRAVSGFIEAGDVHVVAGPWNSIFLEEHSLFPQSTANDIIDTTSLALAELLLANQPATISHASGQVAKPPINSRPTNMAQRGGLVRGQTGGRLGSIRGSRGIPPLP
jgi:phage terminase large subunit-like protein